MTEERLIRGLHPYIAQRMQMERLSKFDLTRLPSADEEVYLFRCVARENPSDDRLVAFAQVRDLTELRDHNGRLAALPTAEDALATCLDSIRRAQSRRPWTNASTPTGSCCTSGRRATSPPELEMIAGRVLPTTAGAGLEEILFIARQRSARTGALTKIAVRIRFDATGGTTLTIGEPSDEPVSRSTTTTRSCARARAAATPCTHRGWPATSPNMTSTTPVRWLRSAAEGARRRRSSQSSPAPTRGTRRVFAGVVLFGDPTKSLGALSEPECRRIVAALDLAERMRVRSSGMRCPPAPRSP